MVASRTALVALTLAALAPPAEAQTCGPCERPIPQPPQGRVRALAALAGPGLTLLALCDEAVVRSADRGRSWAVVALAEQPEDEAGEEPETCGPALAASGDEVLVLDAPVALLSEDAGLTFRELASPLERPACSAALLEDGSVLATAEGELLLLERSRDGLRLSSRLAPELEATVVASAAGLVAVGGPAGLALRGSADRGFRRVGDGALAADLVDLAVDLSGDLWVLTTWGVGVLDQEGRLRPVRGNAGSARWTAIAVASGDRAVLAGDGGLVELAQSCPCPRGLPAELSLPPRRPGRRRVPVSGLLPSIELLAAGGPGRRAFLVALAWPLPRSRPESFMATADERARAAAEQAVIEAELVSAARAVAAGRSELDAPWPPSGPAALEAAVESLLGLALRGVLGPSP